jgi:hypothetical protein
MSEKTISLAANSIVDIPKFLRLQEDGKIILQLKKDHTSDDYAC